MRRACQLGALGLLTALASCGESAITLQAEKQSALMADLIASSQRRLDAVTAGDRDVFGHDLDPEGLFTDEDGVVRTGSALIEQIGPLPSGYEGRLQMANPHARISGDVAIVTYDVSESLRLYGQHLATQYHTTDIYQHVANSWRLIGAQTSVIPSELAPMAIEAARLEEYVGSYRLGDGPIARILQEGAHLYMQRGGSDREELLPIGADRFIRQGHSRGERFFRRNKAGQIDALIDRRDNNDLVWARL